MDTAFTATVQGTRPGRAVGFVCLYDAVQTIRQNGEVEAVHSCGHGVIAGSVVAAALALQDHRDRLAGKLVVFGCPADEIHADGTVARGGGKALSVEAGLWDEMDVGLYSHPEFIDTVSLVSRWMRRERVRVDGTRDLSGELEAPLLAAQAVIGANDLDVMVEHVEFDGDVEGDTSMTMQANLLLFADTEAELEERCATARATVPNGTWTSGVTYRGVRPNDGVTASVREAFAAAGRGFEANPPALPFATDFGNISHRVPAALIGVGRAEGWAFPHRQGTRAVHVGGGLRRGHRDGPGARIERRAADRAALLALVKPRGPPPAPRRGARPHGRGRPVGQLGGRGRVADGERRVPRLTVSIAIPMSRISSPAGYCSSAPASRRVERSTFSTTSSTPAWSRPGSTRQGRHHAGTRSRVPVCTARDAPATWAEDTRFIRQPHSRLPLVHALDVRELHHVDALRVVERLDRVCEVQQTARGRQHGRHCATVLAEQLTRRTRCKLDEAVRAASSTPVTWAPTTAPSCRCAAASSSASRRHAPRHCVGLTAHTNNEAGSAPRHPRSCPGRSRSNVQREP